MKVLFLTPWNRSDLARTVQNGLDYECLIVVRGLDWSEPELAAFLTELGDPSPQYAGHNSTIMHMGERPYEETKLWYDRADGFILHFDGINRIPQRQKMPLTVLYGDRVENVVGGTTYFYDLSTLYARAMSDAVLRRIHWPDVTGLYSRDPLVEVPYEIPVYRFSPYTGRPYLLIDEWFTRNLVPGPANSPHTGLSLLQRYRDGFVEIRPYEHVWEPGDLLIWSNESFVHGRRRILSGTRVLWRGLVWNNHRGRSISGL